MSHSTHSATGSRNNIEQYQLPAIMYLNRLRLSHKYKKIIKYFALNYLYSAYQKKGNRTLQCSSAFIIQSTEIILSQAETPGF